MRNIWMSVIIHMVMCVFTNLRNMWMSLIINMEMCAYDTWGWSQCLRPSMPDCVHHEIANAFCAVDCQVICADWFVKCRAEQNAIVATSQKR